MADRFSQRWKRCSTCKRFSQDGIKRTDQSPVSIPTALLFGRLQAMEEFGGARVDWKLAASALGEAVL
jgi:hypothetical protein